jgi:toxin YoeB
MYLAWHTDCWVQYTNWQTQDKNVWKRINLLLKDIMRDPRSLNGIGYPEKLKYDLADCFSREIDQVNRLVYTIITLDEHELVLMLRCKGHYHDK